MSLIKFRNKINLNFLYESSTDENFIRSAYIQLFGRDADPEGLNFYLKKLKKTSRTEVLLDMLAAEEFKIKEVKFKKNYLLYLARLYSPERKYMGKTFSERAKNNKVLRVFRKELRGFIRYKEENLSKPNLGINSDSNFKFVASNADDQQAEVGRYEVEKLESYIDELFKKISTIESGIIEDNNDIEKSKILLNNTIYLNLTTTRRWRNRAVGIVRTEREIADYFYNNLINVKFVVWSALEEQFFLLPLAMTNYILDANWINPNKNLLPIKDDYLSKPIDIKENDVFVSLGLDWDDDLTSQIFKLKRETKCKVVLACHDIIPILYPEYTVEARFQQLFKKHYIDMFYTADMVWTNSINSKEDLIKFWYDAQILHKKFPIVEIVHLGSDIKMPVKQLTKMTSKIDAAVNEIIGSSQEYALYVSTIEPRKNHALLLNLWREGYKEFEEDWPVLVFVGNQGWGVQNLIDQMQRMLAYRDKKIIWLKDVSDEELVLLYKNCKFSLFPSMYEGWGLGAAESLNLGKPCIVSNNSALDEATQYLMPSADPLDFIKWKSILERMIFDKSYFDSLCEKIKSDYKTKSWQEFSKNFIAKLEVLTDH